MKTTLRLVALLALLLPACRNKEDTGDSGGVCTWYTDADRDGWGVGDEILDFCDQQPADSAAVAGDCDDGNGAVNPGQAEVAYDGLDNDCDPATLDDDLDGDGHGLADDCDDDDPAVSPDAAEICNGGDDDCNGVVDDAVGDLFYADGDGDGFGDPATETRSCEGATGFVADATDCDDDDDSVNLAADEVCDGVDNDCDLLVDDDDPGVLDPQIWYLDADADGFGADESGATACEAPPSYLAAPGDCDDGDAAVNPDATELCNSVDDDCDGLVDDDDDSVEGLSTWWIDSDGDGHGAPSFSLEACDAPTDFAGSGDDCDDGDASSYPGAIEACDGADNDCDGSVDENASDAGTWYADADGDGYGDPDSSTLSCAGSSALVADATDCDDTDAAVNPGAVELCDGSDQDCDGLVDDDDPDVSDAGTWYVDSDGDGYGDSAGVTVSCDQPSATVTTDTDCDDSDPSAYPGATEVCDFNDNDCDALVDDDDPDLVDASTWYLDYDGDGYGQSVFTVDACDAPSGYVDNALDCDDAHSDASPAGTEVCDGLDNDCDGSTDNDPADPSDWYADSDGDGYGDASSTVSACDAPSGTVGNSDDCDDTDAAVSPDTIWNIDADGDGYGSTVYTTAACEQPSGYTPDDSDCDDLDDTIHPAAAEICNGVDDDCDGDVDDDDSDRTGGDTWYADDDGDGYGDATASSDACDAPTATVSDDTDCDDTDSTVHPDAEEVCDGVDRNCDGDPLAGLIDSDGDGLVNCEDPDVYSIDFDSGWEDWSTVDLGGGNPPSWTVTSGTLYEGSDAALSIAYSADLGELDTWTLTVDVYNSTSANNDSGIVFGYLDSSNYYLASWSDPTDYYATGGSVQLIECAAGTCTTLATDDGTTTVTTSSAVWLELAVSVDGEDVSVWWDGIEVVSHTLIGASPVGLDRVGLYTYDNDGGVTYDNLAITNP